MYQVTIVTIDEVHCIDVLKFVTIVKQGIETESTQGVERGGLDLQRKILNKYSHKDYFYFLLIYLENHIFNLRQK